MKIGIAEKHKQLGTVRHLAVYWEKKLEKRYELFCSPTLSPIFLRESTDVVNTIKE